MTLTQHGHRIPGSPSYDDSDAVPVARCGGPTLCRQCKAEAEHYINGRAGAQMKMQAEANGTGDLTAGELMHQLLGIPPEAVVHIRTDGNQMDGSYWSVKAEWDRADTSTPATTPKRQRDLFGDGEARAATRIGESEHRDIQVPIAGDGGFQPVPTTGPITQQNQQHYGELGAPRANDWNNPYKGQWGDH